MSTENVATKADQKATNAPAPKLTDDQWKARVLGSQLQLQRLKTGIVRHVVRNLDTSHGDQILAALGLERPAEPKYFNFSVPATLTQDYETKGLTKADAAANLITVLSGKSDGTTRTSLTREHTKNWDTSALQSIVDAAQVPEVPATADAAPELPPMEQFAALEAEYEALKVAAHEQAKALAIQYKDRYCESGINEVLRELQLPTLPEKQLFQIDVPATGSISMEVSAYNRDEALITATAITSDYQEVTKAGSSRRVYLTNVQVTGEPVVK